jgi:transposase
MDELFHAPPPSPKGEGEMIGFALWTAIHARARRGEATQTMARACGVDRKTVRRLLAQERPTPYQRTVTRPARVSPYWASIPRRVTEVDDQASRRFQALRAPGDTGGDALGTRAVRPLRAERARQAAAPVRVATAPGCQAQVEGGRSGAHRGGQRGRVQVWVLGLGDARRLSGECRREQPWRRLLTGHPHACAWCGGRPAAMRSDTPPTVGRTRDGDGRGRAWPPQGWDCAHDEGGTPRVCRPDRAPTQGQGAAGRKDVTRRCMRGRQVARWDRLPPVAPAWGLTVADPRRQGSRVRTPAAAVREAPRRPHQGQPPYRLCPVRCRQGATAGVGTVATHREAGPPAALGRTVAVDWSPEGARQSASRGTLIARPPRDHGPPQGCGAPGRPWR